MAILSRHGSIEIEVTVKRSELLVRLRDNRAKHEREFNEAIGRWQAELATVLKATRPSNCLEFPHDLKQLREDCPVSHLAEYDQAIDMFTMCVLDEIKLDSESFNTFCRDEWGWKSSVSTNRFYQDAGITVVDNQD